MGHERLWSVFHETRRALRHSSEKMVSKEENLQTHTTYKYQCSSSEYHTRGETTAAHWRNTVPWPSGMCSSVNVVFSLPSRSEQLVVSILVSSLICDLVFKYVGSSQRSLWLNSNWIALRLEKHLVWLQALQTGGLSPRSVLANCALHGCWAASGLSLRDTCWIPAYLLCQRLGESYRKLWICLFLLGLLLVFALYILKY